jgi:hypothetical protein
MGKYICHCNFLKNRRPGFESGQDISGRIFLIAIFSLFRETKYFLKRNINIKSKQTSLEFYLKWTPRYIPGRKYNILFTNLLVIKVLP